MCQIATRLDGRAFDFGRVPLAPQTTSSWLPHPATRRTRQSRRGQDFLPRKCCASPTRRGGAAWQVVPSISRQDGLIRAGREQAHRHMTTAPLWEWTASAQREDRR
eukprot:scaffold62421_cov69-Phaeocystis_antarctica.AAC.5